MKDNNAIAIIVASIIIAISIYLSSLNDPLNKCMDRVIKKDHTISYAAKICSGS